MSERTGASEPSQWVTDWVPSIAPGARVLDLACGHGRHTRMLSSLGFTVVALDRDPVALAALNGMPNVRIVRADIESGDWTLAGQRFGAIIVTNYLYRPVMPTLVDSLLPEGVLIYETFALGNERYGRPSNPAFLLRPGELLDAVAGRLHVIAYEDRYVSVPRPAMIQRICAARTDSRSVPQVGALR